MHHYFSDQPWNEPLTYFFGALYSFIFNLFAPKSPDAFPRILPLTPKDCGGWFRHHTATDAFALGRPPGPSIYSAKAFVECQQELFDRKLMSRLIQVLLSRCSSKSTLTFQPPRSLGVVGAILLDKVRNSMCDGKVRNRICDGKEIRFLAKTTDHWEVI